MKGVRPKLIDPSVELLEIQDGVVPKRGIFDGINDYMSGDVKPMEVKYDDEFSKEAMSGDYDHLHQTCMKWFDVE